MPVLNKQGFGLLEIIVSLGIFVLFAVGIYGGIQYTFKTVYNSRLKILETSIINEEIETLRNMPFEDVGIINGSPAGILTRTSTTTRNNIDFTITRTIRNVDDPFDGTIELGTDLSAADYKFAHIDVICSNCPQQRSVSMDTIIPPKYLEGNPNNGALFIEVLNASGLPVVGATVHVVATSTDPILDLTDTTNNAGKLALVDVPAGQNAYHITISKNGYTSDQTYTPTAQNPNPTQRPASVVAQAVTQVTFTIDEISTLAITTIDNTCALVNDVTLQLQGTDIIGTEPTVLRLDTSITTNAQGAMQLNNYKWDNYTFSAVGYDIIGSIPITPILLSPGIEQPVQLIVGANTNHSLLVHVQDAVNAQPVSNAIVHVTSTGYDVTKTTGVGHIQQTDWIGGSGQITMVDDTRYVADDGQVTVNSPAGQITLRQLGEQYVASGMLESSTFDLGTAANLVNISWEPFAQPAATGDSAVRFQLASSNSSTPDTWEFLGPDGTSSTFYSTNAIAIHEAHNNQQYLRYKLFLHTDDISSTPAISDIAISYTTSCTPPGQTYFANVSANPFTVAITADGYEPYTTVVTVNGDTTFIAPLVSTP